jgi:L-seryl-tRNA(Ser) seleniumtransferase
VFRGAPARAGAAVRRGLQNGKDILRSIGVRPVINAQGPNTMIGGALMLPEVRAAMSDAAQQHADLDELMAAIVARLAPGAERTIATRTASILSNAPKLEPARPPAPPVADISGQWDVQITYAASSSTHRLAITQRGHRLEGMHFGNFVARDLRGGIRGRAVRISSGLSGRQGDSLGYSFVGTIDGNAMSGSLNLGEYLTATWSAKRHI